MRELRQDASRYLALVEAGQTITITMYGRPIARLVPVRDSRLEEMVEAGEATAGSPGPWPEPAETTASVSAVLDALRADRLDDLS